MKAMVLEAPGHALRLVETTRPDPAPGQVLIRVAACGVCRTDLHVVDGGLADPKLPLVPGHQIVGTVAEAGEGAKRFGVAVTLGAALIALALGALALRRRTG